MAIFKLLVTLKYRQLNMSIIQIMCPLIGLIITTLLKEMVLSNAEALANVSILLPIPFIYNIPLKPLSNFEGMVFNVSECHEFYMYSFENDVPQEDRDYFGKNTGSPMKSPETSGMLSAGRNVLTSPCTEVNKTVPYF
jgi:ABC-type multidrug transport system ATPase subunit